MRIVCCAIFCLLMKVLSVVTYDGDFDDFSGDGIEWIDDPRNCYDEHGQVTLCPYLPDPVWADYDVVCLPDEPYEGLGPPKPNTHNRRRYPISNDCPDRKCKRRFHVGQHLAKDFFDAKSKCERMNMRLVSIESKRKWEDVKEALSKAHGVSDQLYYYTSGMRDGNGTFSWGSGCPFTFANWGVRGKSRQPDNWNEDEYCVEIRGLHPHYGWSDYPCRAGPSYVNWWDAERRSYMCESLTCSPDPPDDYNPTTNDCDNNDSCCGKRIYYVGQEDVNGVNEAQAECEVMNMRLVSIETEEKWKDVLEAISNSGQTDKTRSYFTSGRRSGRDGSFSWGSGCPFDYTDWRGRNAAQDPERCNGPYCVAIQGGRFKWDDVECRNSVRSYICESLTCNLKAVPNYPNRPDVPHETHGNDKPAKPAKPSEPSNPSNPANPARPSNPSNPPKPSNPSNPPKPSNPYNPDEPYYPDEPYIPGDPDDPNNPSDPDDPYNPSHPVQPHKPAKPHNQFNPDDPNNPLDPDEPYNPSKPSHPSKPYTPANPAKPHNLTNPDEPYNPLDPSRPYKPYKPTRPDKPSTPAKPAKPSDPLNPVKPHNPSNPDDPYNPHDPSRPYKPYKPTRPGKPSTPAKPSDPLNPVKPHNPSNPDEPYNPLDPSRPYKPYKPIRPGKPSTPAKPAKPSDPLNPVKPHNPSTPDDPYNPLDPSRPYKPYKPIRPGKPSTPAKPAKPSDPLNPVKPHNPSTPDDPYNPLDPDEPYIPSKPSHPSKPYTPAKPHNPLNPDEPYNPLEPSRPYKPYKPIRPGKPSTPAKPAKPSDPLNPVKPHNPSNPDEPYNPLDPSRPYKPYKPTRPGKPSTPAKPAKPSDPLNPVKPHNPSNPDEPYNPLDPSRPYKPYKPTRPGKPSTPAKPAKPSDPLNPVKPHNPSEPNNPFYPAQPLGPYNPSKPGGRDPVTNDCPDRKCKRRYHVGKIHVRNIYDAKATCERLYMRLVSIESKEKWKDVKDAIYKAAGGANDRFYYTSGMRDGMGTFSWGSGCPFAFANWGPPDNSEKDEYCVVIHGPAKGSVWNDYPCYEKYNYNDAYSWSNAKRSVLCESLTCSTYPANDTDDNPTTNDCDNNDSCCGKRNFYVGFEKVNSVYEAQAKCEALNMRLVSIETGEKLKEVKKALANSGYYDKRRSYYVSGRRDGSQGKGKGLSKASFHWESGCPVDRYTVPKGGDINSFCLEMSDFSGYFKQAQCHGSGRYYVCESLTCVCTAD